MNFQQFKKLNYVTFYRHTFSYNLKLQLIIYDAGECLCVLMFLPQSSLCVFGSNICWNTSIHPFFLLHQVYTNTHTRDAFFHFTDVYPFFTQKSSNDKKTHEKIFVERKVEREYPGIFHFSSLGFFLFSCVYIFAFSQSVIKRKNLTKRLRTFFRGKEEEEARS